MGSSLLILDASESSTVHPSLEPDFKAPGLSDLALLPGTINDDPKIIEEAVMKVLRDRFDKECIYTFIGNVVIAMNPYKPLMGMYGSQAQRLFREHRLSPAPPHIFALTDLAYRCDFILMYFALMY
jgi:myosin heavy subunit